MLSHELIQKIRHIQIKAGRLVTDALAGEYSSAFINGVFSLKENQQHEIRSTINHLVENTKSYQLI